jgi:hypothetical protein
LSRIQQWRLKSQGFESSYDQDNIDVVELVSEDEEDAKAEA